MQKTILYLLLLLVSAASFPACHRQLARVQPTPQVSYQTVAVPGETTPTESFYVNTREQTRVVSAPNPLNESAVSVLGNDAVASTKSGVLSHPKLAKRMVAIRHLLDKHQAVSRKPLSVERKKHPKRVAEDTKGTLGLLGLIFSGAGLLLILIGGPLGLLFTIAGLVLSILGLKGRRRGMALAGLIISGITLLLFLVVVVLLASVGFS